MYIPERFKDTKKTQNQDNVYPQVEHLSLQPRNKARFQKLLRARYSAFPNLKHLQLCYYSGIWNKEHNEFRILSPHFSLQSLSIDVTPIAKKIQAGTDFKKMTKEQTFFILEVNFLNNGRQSFYLVSAHALKVLKVDTTEMKAYIQQINFVRLKITINSLQCLQFCVYKEVVFDKVNDTYCCNDNSNKGKTLHATVFKQAF